jgi:plasmid stabilization system protein ParE
VSQALAVKVSELAAGQIRAAESWWRANRSKAPNAIREELERASSLIAIQPGIGTPTRSARLLGVRRVHLARIRYDLYYRVADEPRQVEILAFCKV